MNTTNKTVDTAKLPEFTWGLVNLRTGRIHSIVESRAKARARKRDTDRVIKLVAVYDAKA